MQLPLPKLPDWSEMGLSSILPPELVQLGVEQLREEDRQRQEAQQAGGDSMDAATDPRQGVMAGAAVAAPDRGVSPRFSPSTKTFDGSSPSTEDDAPEWGARGADGRQPFVEWGAPASPDCCARGVDGCSPLTDWSGMQDFETAPAAADETDDLAVRNGLPDGDLAKRLGLKPLPMLGIEPAEAFAAANAAAASWIRDDDSAGIPPEIAQRRALAKSQVASRAQGDSRRSDDEWSPQNRTALIMDGCYKNGCGSLGRYAGFAEACSSLASSRAPAATIDGGGHNFRMEISEDYGRRVTPNGGFPAGCCHQ